MFQLAHKGEPARTTTIVPKPKAPAPAQALPQALEENQFLSSGPEDGEPSVDPEDFGKGGVEVEPEDLGNGGVDPEEFGKRGVDSEPSVDPEGLGKGGVEVESEYDLELRIGG